MKYLASQRLVASIVALALLACPMVLEASVGHLTRSKVVPNHVASHPKTSHYTQKAQQHEVVKHWHPQYVTNKAQKHKKAHHSHVVHVKKHHSPTA